MRYLLYRLARFLVLPLFLGYTASVSADWINLTGAETSPNIAEIYVHDDHVRVKLEVYVADLEIFDELVPDEWLRDADGKRPSLESRLQRFSQHKLKFVTDRGEVLPVRVELIEPRMRMDRRSPFAGMINPYTRQRVAEPPADKRVLYAELIYPFKGKPKTLTVVPPLDAEGRAKATIGFITYHKAVPVIDFRYLGAAATLNLEWNDPWYSKFNNPNLKRHHKSALMSFLYVEPHEVRHEILIRIKDLENWMALGLRGNEYIEVDELEGLKQRLGNFLLQKNTLKVDGKALKPILDRSNYVKVGITGIQLLEQPQRLEISTAIVGIIITYLTEGMPQEVTVNWELFTDQIQRVPATATDPAGPLPTFLTPDDNVHKWTNFLKNYVPPTVARVEINETVEELRVPIATILGLTALIPMGLWIRNRKKSDRSLRWPILLALGLIVVAGGLYPYVRITTSKPLVLLTQLSNEEANVILASLLKNVYRSFDFRDESDVYDKLALSIQGDLLTEIYLQNRKSFAIKQAGGAQAQVKEVNVLEATARAVPGNTGAFVLEAQWTALGTVGHWGHVHTRKNFYAAAITIEAIEGAWKITALDLLEEKRVEPYAKPSKEAALSVNSAG